MKIPPTIRKEAKKMRAVRGYKKSDYQKMSPNVMEFDSIQEAAEYLAEKHSQPVEDMVKAIENDTNCDAIYFEDGSVVLLEM